MSHEYACPNMCLHCKHDNAERLLKLKQYEQSYKEERNKEHRIRRKEELDRIIQKQRMLLRETLCLHCSEANDQGHDVINCQICDTVQHGLQQEKDRAIKELEQKCEQLRYEADINKKKLEDFKDRMSVEASAEMGCSNEIFEDINNPCRESELRRRYEMLRLNTWPKFLQKIKENSNMRREETADVNKENVERMIKNVFEKALADMEKKKEDMKKFFTTSETKSVYNKKQLQCMALAIQNLQIFILYENITYYQDVNKELGNKDPDYLSELADQCYKQGCLMALHNPPLILEWSNKNDHCGCPFPPIKLG